jgi:hypothetical protein
VVEVDVGQDDPVEMTDAGFFESLQGRIQRRCRAGLDNRRPRSGKVVDRGYAFDAVHEGVHGDDASEVVDHGKSADDTLARK